MSKVLNISRDDYSNFSYCNAEALKAAGVECESMKSIQHPFGYKTQSEVVSSQKLREAIQRADLIQIMHSDQATLEMCKGLGKRLVVYHTGSRYRQNPGYFNSLFNPHVEISFTDQTEFIGLGSVNEQYIATAVNTDTLKSSSKKVGEKLTFAHYPSNHDVKGTERIREMMKDFEGSCELLIDINKVPHDQQLARMRACDVYIELFASHQEGKPYGCFGVTAFEAAAMGKVVITQNINPKVYSDVYGDPIFIYGNNEAQFKKAVEMLIASSDIVSLQKRHRSMIVERHSLKATGQRLRTILNV